MMLVMYLTCFYLDSIAAVAVAVTVVTVETDVDQSVMMAKLTLRNYSY